MGKGWRDDFDAMARKTVYRKLIGKWGVMSIDYQSREDGMSLAEQMAEENKLEYGDSSSFVEADFDEVDTDTGEVTE